MFPRYLYDADGTRVGKGTITSMSRRAKIEMLSRANRRKAAIPRFLRTLSDLLKQRVEEDNLLPVDESDALWEVFRCGYRTAQSADSGAYRKFFPPDARRMVSQLATCVANHLINERAFFLTKLGNDTVAIEVSLLALLERADSIIEFDGDSITVLSRDRTQGLLFDWNEGDPVQAFEVVIWGSSWPLVVLECEKTYVSTRSLSPGQVG